MILWEWSWGTVLTNLVLDLRHRVESHPNCGDNHKEDRDQRDYLRMKIMMVTIVATTLVMLLIMVMMIAVTLMTLTMMMIR